jgi:hypothetical protein
MKYGARHLKRAIDRSLVHSLSNLIATDQVRSGDLVRVDYDAKLNRMTFIREAEDLPNRTLLSMVDTSFDPAPRLRSASASVEPVRITNVRQLSR